MCVYWLKRVMFPSFNVHWVYKNNILGIFNFFPNYIPMSPLCVTFSTCWLQHRVAGAHQRRQQGGRQDRLQRPVARTSRRRQQGDRHLRKERSDGEFSTVTRSPVTSTPPPTESHRPHWLATCSGSRSQSTRRSGGATEERWSLGYRRREEPGGGTETRIH